MKKAPISMHGHRHSYAYLLPLLFILLFILALTSSAPLASAGGYGDGCPFDNWYNGTLHGGIYFQTKGHYTSAGESLNETFENVPAGRKIVRLYTGVWLGSPSAGRVTTFNISVNNHTDTYSFTDNRNDCTDPPQCDLVDEPECNADYTGCGAVSINYNATDHVVNGTNYINISTEEQLYQISLLVIYENESMPEIQYWVKEGHVYPDDNYTLYFNETVNTGGIYTGSIQSLKFWTLGYPHGPGSAAWPDLNGNYIGACDYVYSYDADGAVYEGLPRGKEYEVFYRWDSILPDYISSPSNRFYYPALGNDRMQVPVLMLNYSEPSELNVTDVSPESLCVDYYNTVDATIVNLGGTARLFNATLYVNGTVVDVKPISNLGEGESTTVKFLWNPNATGSYVLNVTADVENVIKESDKTNNSRTLNVEVTVASLPEWQSQSSNVGSIPSGGTIELRAQGSADLGLDHAILATDETGSWLNITDGRYGSPLDMDYYYDYSLTHTTESDWKAQTIDANLSVVGDDVKLYRMVGTTNLALNQPAYADSYYSIYEPGEAVDGTSDPWVSGELVNRTGWWYVDLGGVKDVQQIKIDFHEGWGSVPYKYTVDISNNAADWTTKIERSVGHDETYDNLGWSCRYIRVNVLDVLGSNPYVAIAEFEAYPPGDYKPSGTLTSSAISTDNPVVAVLPTWSLTEPSGTSLSLNVSVDNGATWKPANNGEEMTFDYDTRNNKLKYRVLFQTTNVSETPVLHDISLDYTMRDPIEGTWLWSNFTWHNPSVSGRTVGWKIYYTDTVGNTTCTDVKTFDVGAPGPAIELRREQANTTGLNQETTVRLIVWNTDNSVSNVTSLNLTEWIDPNWTVTDCGSCSENTPTYIKWTLGNLEKDNYTMVSYKLKAPSSSENSTFKANCTYNYGEKNGSTEGSEFDVAVESGKAFFDFELDMDASTTAIDRDVPRGTEKTVNYTVTNVGDAVPCDTVFIELKIDKSAWNVSCSYCDEFEINDTDYYYLRWIEEGSSWAVQVTKVFNFTVNSSQPGYYNFASNGTYDPPASAFTGQIYYKMAGMDVSLGAGASPGQEEDTANANANATTNEPEPESESTPEPINETEEPEPQEPVIIPPLTENLKIIGKDSFSANETPEFIVETQKDFIAVAGNGKPAQIEIYAEDGDGKRIEVIVEESSPNGNSIRYHVTISNHKTSKFEPGIYKLVVVVGEQSVEHPFEWGLEEPEPEEPLILPPSLNLSENLKIIGNDSFSANETPEFVIQIEQSFIEAVSDADSGEPVEIQIYVEGSNGSRIELFVEEEETSPSSNISIYRVTIPNNKTGTEEITPGTYTLVVAVGEQSVEYPFNWGLEPEAEPEEPLIIPPLSDNLKIIGNDSFSANETPEFVIEIQNDFIASVANLSDSKPAIQIHAENSEGNRIEVIVEEISSSSNITNVSVYKVTIPNHKTGKFKPGTYKLVVELGGQSIEYPFEWGPQPTIAPALSLTTAKKHFVLNENPVFKFKFNFKTKNESKTKTKTNETGLKPLAISEPKKAAKNWVAPQETIKTAVYYKDELLDIEPEIEKLGEGDFSIKIPTQRAFRAGLYKLRVELVTDNETYVEEQDFTWGVLAINTHKSIYLPDETAFIGIAVLDNEGHMVCDAAIALTITDPDNKETVLSTNNGLIKVSPECSVYGVTNLPDYYTNYEAAGVGTYVMNLTAVTPDGTKSITDEFTVQSSVDFDVARDGPTRIYPPVPYVMNFIIKANKNYTGLIKEYVPAPFVITSQEGLTATTVGDTKILTWNKNLVKGETYNIAYEFDAPDISPYLFVLGRLQIGGFEEKRDWMIASDAPDTTNLAVSSCNIDDVNNTDCYNAVLNEGGTTYALEKGKHMDAYISDLSVQSINSVVIYYKVSGTLSGTWTIEGTDGHDGTVLCSKTGEESGNMTLYSLNCPNVNIQSELNNLVVKSTNNDDKGPESITFDGIYVYVDYTPPVDTTPPASIISLYNITYEQTYINWSWTNPGDADFNYTMVYINGTWKENVSSPFNYYNATGLSPNTNNTISTHTVDTSGNVNLSWVNHSAWTAPTPDTTAPLITDENLNTTEINTGETVRLNATTSDPESDVTEVKFKIKYPNGTATNFSATELTTSYWEYNFSDTSLRGKYNWTDTYAISAGGTNHTTPGLTFIAFDTTNIDQVLVNDTSPDRGATVNIKAHLINSSGGEIEGQNITFKDGVATIGSDLTNSTGWAEINWNIAADESLGSHTINATYDGNASEYYRASYNDTESITVWAATAIPQVLINNTNPAAGDIVKIEALLQYDNTSVIQNQNISFYYDSTYIDSDFTNSTGWATINWDTTGVPGGTRIINATYSGNSSIYTSASYNNTQEVTITEKIWVTNIEMHFVRVAKTAAVPDTTPPASITNLHNTTYAPTHINWSWANPADADFSHVMVYINGAFKENILSPLDHYTATGLSPNTNNTISTHTVDTSGNVNLSWVNHSAWTASAEAPTVETITITPDESGEEGVQIIPNPGGTKTVTVTAQVNDPNGYEDIQTVEVSNINPAPTQGSTATMSYVSGSGSGTTATYGGTFVMQFYEASTTYTVTVTATDTGGLTGSNSSSFKYQTCIALELDVASISFGSVDPGSYKEVTGDTFFPNTAPTIKNTGNVEIDMKISGTDMSGAAGTIAVGNIADDLNNPDGYAALSPTPTEHDELNLTTGASSVHGIDFKLNVPLGTSAGNYSGTVTLEAKLDD